MPGLNINTARSKIVDYGPQPRGESAPIEDIAVAKKVDETNYVITRFWDTFSLHGAMIMTRMCGLSKMTYLLRAGVQGDWYKPVDDHLCKTLEDHQIHTDERSFLPFKYGGSTGLHRLADLAEPARIAGAVAMARTPTHQRISPTKSDCGA